MTNAEIIANVQRWQATPYVHPLTCGGEHCRGDLEAVEQEGKVVLRCPSCGYVQRWIPEVVARGTVA